MGLGAAVLGFVEQFEGCAGGLCEPSGVGETGPLGGECGQFVGLQAERVEFAHHVTQQVEAIVAIARVVFELCERRGAIEPLAMQARESGRERFAARIGVEQAPLGCGLEQRLELVLAVDLGEQGADLAQALYGDLLAIEVGARFAFTGDHATHDELVVGLDALLGEPAAHRRVGGAKVEGRDDLCPGSIVADGLGTGSSAHGELQRVDEDGLSGAGLAGEHGQSVVQFDLDGIDDREIPDLQVGEHGGGRAAWVRPGGRRRDAPS